MRTLRRFKKILPVFLLILQILFSFAPLTTLIPTASAQEAKPQPIQIDSQLKLDNYRGNFAVYYLVGGQIMAHQGTSAGNLDLFLGSVSGEDQIKHNPDRVVVKTEGQTYHLLMQQVENNYRGSNLDLSSADEDFLFNNWRVDISETVKGNRYSSFTSQSFNLATPPINDTNVGPVVEVDITAPTVTVITPDGDFFKDDQIIIQGTVDDAESKIDKVQMDIVNTSTGSVSGCTTLNATIGNNKFDWSLNLASVNSCSLTVDGEYKIRAWAYSKASNPGWATEKKFYLDKTPPSVPVLTWPIDGDYINDNTPLMQWDDSSDDMGVGVKGYLYRIYYNCSDVNDSSTCTSVYPNSNGLFLGNSQYQAGVTPDNVYYWQVRAEDQAGNQSDWSALEKMVIDTTVPEVPSGIYFKDTVNNKTILCGGKTNTNHINVYWNDIINDPTFSHFEYSSFGAPNGNAGLVERRFDTNYFASSWWTIPMEGVYGVQLRSVDFAGNKSAWSGGGAVGIDHSCQYIVDWTAPTIPTLNYPEDGFQTQGIAFDQSWHPVSDAIGYEYQSCHVDPGDSGGDCTNIRWPQTFDGVDNIVKHVEAGQPNGKFWWRVRSKDAAGNLSSWSESREITIDNTAPDFAIDGIKYDNGSVVNKFVTNDNTPTIVGRALSSDMVSIDLKVNDKTYSTSVTTGSWEVKITDIIPDGTYQMELIATDGAGNSKSTSIALTIDTVAPTAIHTYYKNGQAILGDAEVYAQSTNQLSFTGEYTDASPSSGLYWDSFVIFEAQDDGSFSFSANGKKAYCSWREQPNLVNLSGSSFSLTDQISFADCETDLEDGVYYLAHHIYDSATRKDIPSINQFRDVLGLKFNIDATAPSSNISNPDGDTYHSDPILIEGNTSDSNGVVSVKLSSALYENESCGEYSEITTLNLDPALTSYNWTYSWTPSLEGQYCIKAQGLDVAGNLEQSSVVKNVIYDKTIPEVDLTVTPTDPDGSGNWYITRPEVTLTDSDNFAVDYIQYRWGATGSWNTYSAPLLLPAEGTNTLYYRAVDQAGNLSEEGIKTLQWDQTELTEGPLNIKADPNPTADSSSTISWDDATDNIGINKYQITWDLRDGDDKHSKEVAGDVTETEINELKEGSYKITVTAYDGSGYNRSASTTLVVDRTAPVAPSLTLTASRAGEVDLSWTTVADADRYIIYYGLEAGNYLYAADVGNVTSYTVQGLTAGNYYFVVRAVDESDNQGANSNEVSILALTGAPAGTIVAEGFTEAGVVQGETTEASAEEQAAMNEEIAKQGEVKGAAITCTNLSKSLFWIFLVVQAVIMLLLAKFSKRAWLKLLAFLLLPALFTVIIKRMGLANCFSNETMIWLSNNYYLPAYLAAMLTKILELLLITD